MGVAGFWVVLKGRTGESCSPLVARAAILRDVIKKKKKMTMLVVIAM